jgi:hypothetical protein
MAAIASATTRKKVCRCRDVLGGISEVITNGDDLARVGLKEGCLAQKKMGT